MEDLDDLELCFPQFPNASCWKQSISQSKVFLQFFLFFVVSVFSVCLNLLVIISISHFRQLHTPTNLLILSLAVSDFFLGFTTLLEAYKQTTCWYFGDVMCSLYVLLCSIIFGSSTGNMILISVDRYLAICDPLHYSTRVTVKRAKTCVCISWTCCAVYNGLILTNFFTHPDKYRICYGWCQGDTDSILKIVDNVLTSLAPVTVMIILYLRVFVVAVSQARAMRSHVAAVTLKPSGTVTKSELKAARNLGVVVLAFLLCYCPYYSCTFVPPESVGPFFNVCYFLLQINPSLNPVIYASLYPWFRKSIRLIFSLQILQPGSRETNML